MYVHGCEWTPNAEHGKRERHFRFSNTQEGWADLLAQVDHTCWVALEVTGSAFEAYDRLSPHVERVLLVDPRQLVAHRARRHSDRVDAARLAMALPLHSLSTVWVPPLAMREIRRLLHYRDRLGRARRRFVNQAKRVFARHGILLPSHADVAHAAKTQDLRVVPIGDRVILASALRQLAALDTEIQTLEAEIAGRIHNVPAVRQLLTITNVGMITAAAIWAGLGDPHRFKTPRQVSRYVGLDPTFIQSGEKFHTGRISKHGNSMLRTLLVEAAQGISRHDQGPLGQFVRRKTNQLGAKKAVVATARKLLVVAWRMLLTGEAYRTPKPPQTARKLRKLERAAQHALSLNTVESSPLPSTSQPLSRRNRSHRTLVPA
jgi:transposase